MNISIQDIQRRLANNRISVDGSRIASMDMSPEQGLILKVSNSFFEASLPL